MKKGRVNAVYDGKYVKENRTFPTGNTVLLVVLVIAQILLAVFAVVYDPKPQDEIHRYNVTVEPMEDGSLDIEYFFVWEALDTSEELTWIEIGMANENYAVYPDSLSSTIRGYSKWVDEDYVTLRLDLDRAYTGGETLAFSFKINQENMLCVDGNGFFFEFVPGWFNSTPVEKYDFRWRITDNSTGAENAVTEGEYYTWSGSLECGGYEKLLVRYTPDAFIGCDIAEYSPFDDSGAYNDLKESKAAMAVMTCLLIGVLIAVEVYIVDSYVSYHRGRGFLTGYGYHVHTYGRTNPWYTRERDKHAAQSSSRGGRSGGCACACACACAGGGRAGCSQKDTYGVTAHTPQTDSAL